MRPQAVSATGQKKGIFSLEPDEAGRRVPSGSVDFFDLACKIRLESMWRPRMPEAARRAAKNDARACLAQNGRRIFDVIFRSRLRDWQFPA